MAKLKKQKYTKFVNAAITCIRAYKKELTGCRHIAILEYALPSQHGRKTLMKRPLYCINECLVDMKTKSLDITTSLYFKFLELLEIS